VIENKIDELIAAIDRLTAALGEQSSPAPAPAPVKEAPVKVVAPEPTQTPKAPSAADKIADMENRCRALARKDPKTMRTAILDLLEGYGSKTIKGVPEDKLDELSGKLAELEG
jgi:hypothetical protein